MASGALAVIVAQVGLYFSVELNTKAPLGYLILLAIGVGLFAFGSLGLWFQRSSRSDGTSDPQSPATSIIQPVDFRSRYRAIAPLAGALVMVVLLGLLAAGWESGSALFLWVAALAAFSTLFWRPLTGHTLPFATVVTFLRRYSWDVSLVALIVVVFLPVNLYDLQHWYYSAIGDEYLFFEHAKRVIDEGIVRPFSQEGVYNKHPVLNSVFQASVMRVFGVDYFGWTFSEALNAAIVIPAIYLLGRTLGGRITAISAAAIFAFSHYIFAFSHTGYTNLSSLPVAAWALTLFVLGWRNHNPLLIYAAGLVAGLGFYTHYSGRAIIPIIAAFSLTAGSPNRLLHLWPIALGFVLAIAPTFLVEQEAILTRMLEQVVGGYSQAVTGSVGHRLLSNIELNLQAFNYNSAVHTYVYGPLLDPISGVLAALGVGFALGHMRQSAYRLLLIWFGVGIFMTGVLSPYPHVAITRLLFTVPPLALMAGLLIQRWSDVVPSSRAEIPGLLKNAFPPVLLAVVLPAVLILNLWQFWTITPTVFPHSQEAVALGAYRSDSCSGDASATIFAGRATGEASLLSQILAAMYPNGPWPRRIEYQELATSFELPEPPVKCVVFVSADAPEALKLQEELARRYPDGRLSSFTNQSGTTAVEVFIRQ